MDRFISDFELVASWFFQIFGGMVDFFKQYPVALIILVAGIGYLAIDMVLMMLSGHSNIQVPHSKPIKGQRKNNIRGQGKGKPVKSSRFSFLSPGKKSGATFKDKSGQKMSEVTTFSFMGGKAFTSGGGGGGRHARGSSRKEESYKDGNSKSKSQTSKAK